MGTWMINLKSSDLGSGLKNKEDMADRFHSSHYQTNWLNWPAEKKIACKLLVPGDICGFQAGKFFASNPNIMP